MTESNILTIEPLIDKLAAAMAAAQGQLTNPPKTKTAHVGKYSYQYADLAEIIEHVRPVLASNGLAVVQMTTHEPEGNSLRTRVIHASGQYLESSYPLPKTASAQDMGSAITYARRYSLCAMLGIAAEEDDDGAKATKAETVADPLDELAGLMAEAGIGNRAVMAYAKRKGLGEGKTIADLNGEVVEALIRQWDPEAIKAQPADPLPPAAKPVEPAGTGDNLVGLDPELARRMAAANITRAQLKAYYVAAKHLPDTIEPEKLPASYLKALLAEANWTKAVKHMNGGK